MEGSRFAVQFARRNYITFSRNSVNVAPLLALPLRYETDRRYSWTRSFSLLTNDERDLDTEPLLRLPIGIQKIRSPT
jgi:hypothetical protein